jgi:hypothetical protein
MTIPSGVKARRVPRQEEEKYLKISAHADGVLAPGSAHARPSAQPPIDMRGNFPTHVSAESPSYISPNCLELISKVSENFKNKKNT